MKKAILFFLFTSALALGMQAGVVVKPSQKTGDIKIMNAVNNGPVVSKSTDQVRDNFQAYKDCGLPFARTHDATFKEGEHVVDISGIFPDFSKDVNDPSSYDFILTDRYLGNILSAGTQVFFRMGQSIEHKEKKYHIMPPKDYQKWAEICEHVIRHYNEGWNNGYHWNILYWEIWNEADLDADDLKWQKDPRTWGGSKEDFFEFYKVAANHLNRCFPDVKIGGPALAGNEKWADEFLSFMSRNKVEIDFFSWHIYSTQPSEIAAKADRMRALMVKYGYGEAESILNEWNYVHGWTDTYQYSADVISSMKGAAFVSAVLSACQKKPVDMLMYYDARYGTIFNGLFDFYDFQPRQAYYAMYAWNKLRKLGSEVQATTDEKDVYVTAASDGKRCAILLTRYNEDDNVRGKKTVKVQIEGLEEDAEIISHLTDSSHKYTEVPLTIEDGQIRLSLEPEAFVMIEIR